MISSGSGSGIRGLVATPRPRLREDRSEARHFRTFARGGDKSSSIGASSALATLTSTVSDGLPFPDSRLEIVERGTPAAFASACCVTPRTCLRLIKLRARCAAVSSGLSISLSFVQPDGHATTAPALAPGSLLRRRRASMSIPLESPEGTPNPALRVAITGGTSGLGLALVREWGARGARIAFVARDRGRVERTTDQEGAFGIVGDIARKDEIYPIATQILGSLGGLDVLVNNASSLGPTPLALLGDTDCEDFAEAIATNLLGPFRLTKALLGALAASAREGRGGVVLNISSDAAITPYPGWGAYAATKAALHHMIRIWNAELAAEGVRFLSLDPGDMDTPLHAIAVPDADPSTLKRPADAAKELADAIGHALRGKVAVGGAQ